MYRLGRGTKKPKKRFVWLFVLLVLLAGLGVAGVFFFHVIYESEEEFTLPKPIVHEYAQPDDGMQVVEQTGFRMKLPKDWEFRGHDTDRYNLYRWRSSAETGGNRELYVYVDTFPAEQAFNRIVPVYVDSNRIIVSGPISDNCTTFTDPHDTATTKTMPAKWQGANFLCDIANAPRNVVGVAVVNKQTPGVELTGATGGRRTYMFVYIDATIQPDHEVLDAALASFEVK